MPTQFPPQLSSGPLGRILQTLESCMFKVLIHLSILFVFAFELGIAQSEINTDLFRANRPFAGKIGFEGIGVDVTAGSVVALEATSFLVSNTAKARVFLLKKNAAPFIGIGVGNATSFGGGNRSWTVLLAGWQQDYERLFFDIMVEATIDKTNSYDRSVFPVNFEIGWRF